MGITDRESAIAELPILQKPLGTQNPQHRQRRPRVPRNRSITCGPGTEVGISAFHCQRSVTSRGTRSREATPILYLSVNEEILGDNKFIFKKKQKGKLHQFLIVQWSLILVDKVIDGYGSPINGFISSSSSFLKTGESSQLFDPFYIDYRRRADDPQRVIFLRVPFHCDHRLGPQTRLTGNLESR